MATIGYGDVKLTAKVKHDIIRKEDAVFILASDDELVVMTPAEAEALITELEEAVKAIR